MFVRYQEMTDITQCPQCGTHFKITREQRKSHKGMVRCGRCQTVFNAAEHLYSEPAQQLDLPLVLDDIADVTGLHAVYKPQAGNDSTVSISSRAAARLANDFSHIPDVYVEPAKPPLTNKQKWLWASASVVAAILLVLQASYYFRVEIAARLPGLKPGMTRLCAQLNCSIPLPQKIDLLSIESSELEADPAQDNIITLHALLRSRASYPLAYPIIELTLTDTQDNALARRFFSPAEYMSPKTDEKRGFPANREANIKLHLNTTDLKPAGYRLFLFYPQ